MVVLILPLSHLGAWSELAKTTEDFVALKPLSLSMEDAASIPLAAMTALQALRRYSGDLAGKTVFVPAGCMASHDHPPYSSTSPKYHGQKANHLEWAIVSGTGLFACQLAKKIFNAGKVITTVSTAKVARVNEFLGEGVVDESKFDFFF